MSANLVGDQNVAKCTLEYVQCAKYGMCAYGVAHADRGTRERAKTENSILISLILDLFIEHDEEQCAVRMRSTFVCRHVHVS